MTRDEIKRVVGYMRVSTAEQGRSGLGLEGQRSAIVSECAHRGWELVGGEPYCDIISGKSLNGRHELKRALDDLAARRADALVVAKLDRLSRSVVDFGRVLKLSQRHGWALVILDLDLDTSTPTGKLMANVLISVAEWERDTIAQRTRTALAAKKSYGGKLGRERLVLPTVEARILRMRKRGMSFQEIAAKLTADGIPAPTTEAWGWTTIKRVVRRHINEVVVTRQRRVSLD